jgi:hypothetical protein
MGDNYTEFSVKSYIAILIVIYFKGIKCSRVGWVAHATRTDCNTYKISAKRPEGQTLRRWKDIHWMRLAEDRGL